MQTVNPYIVGNAVGGGHAFVGRNDILQEVYRTLQHPQHNAILLHGQRRIGKTSILRELEAKLPSKGNYCPVFFDLLGKAHQSIAQIVQDLANQISDKLDQGKPQLGEDPKGYFYNTWLPNLLQTEEKNFVLLFDEFDALDDKDELAKQTRKEFFRYLSDLLAIQHERLNFVFVIGRNVDDLTDTTMALFKEIPNQPISLLNKEDTLKLIHLSKDHLQWSEEAKERVWELTQGHPLLTQQLCSCVWEYLYDELKHKPIEAVIPSGEKHSQGVLGWFKKRLAVQSIFTKTPSASANLKATLTVPSVLPEHIEAVIATVLERGENSLEWLWGGLEEIQQVFLSATAEAGNGIVTKDQLDDLLSKVGVKISVSVSELENTPQSSLKLGLIKKEGDGYRFTVELMRRLVTQYKPLSSVKHELEHKAHKYYQKAVDLHYHGNDERALVMLNKTLRLSPDYSNAQELKARLIGQDQVGAKMKEGQNILKERYQLKRKISSSEDNAFEMWEGEDTALGEPCTIKLWFYKGEQPPKEIRRVWDDDLRTMYRLSSTPGAPESLIVMKDASVDSENQALVMVFEGINYQPLSSALKDRDTFDWLKLPKLRDTNNRQDLWKGLQRIARGIQSLHEQYLIHRNIGADTIFFLPGSNSDSLRLGGFDWRVRLGYKQTQTPEDHWVLPPELFTQETGYSFSSDWYAFGMFLARCFFKLEHLTESVKSSQELNDSVFEQISRENPCELFGREKDFIKQLIAPSAINRLINTHEILTHVDSIIDTLSKGHKGRGNDSLLLVFDVRGLADQIRETGFVPNQDDPYEVFNENNKTHIVLFKDFLHQRLTESKVYRLPNKEDCVLEGKDNLFLKIRQSYNHKEKQNDWEFASVNGVISSPKDRTEGRDLSVVQIEICTFPMEARQKLSGAPATYKSWDHYIPQRGNQPASLAADAENLRSFLRCTNQLEILLRDAQIFAYQLQGKAKRSGGFEQITLIERPEQQQRPSRNFFKMADRTLMQFLQQELDTGKQYCNKVLLTDSDSLYLRLKTNEADEQSWEIKNLDRDNSTSTLTLTRRFSTSNPEIKKEGFIRSRGHHGQIWLIDRRKKAIDRLINHAYLLRTLVLPKYVRIDTKLTTEELPWPLEESSVDSNKIAIITDILRVRPIYVLQGPPGTGKTTLVAHLLRQILTEDPMAQIIVTAKDHYAVNVLMNKVDKEVYQDNSDEFPIAVRLGNKKTSEVDIKTVEQVTEGLVNKTYQNLQRHLYQSSQRHPFNTDWQNIRGDWQKEIDYVNNNLGSQDSKVQGFLNGLQEMVKRGASITYCTTSSGDLEELAKGAQSFDWSVIEEAGKTHGFDLALPMQAGHRWILLGDQRQLKPFQYEDFADCVKKLDDAVITLREIGKNNKGMFLLDSDWIEEWGDFDSDRKERFKNFVRGWLPTFERIFSGLEYIEGDVSQITTVESKGASVGRLNWQYRMHYVIGNLVSTVFYKREIQNATATTVNNGEVEPKPESIHPFIAPAKIAGKAIVWLDIPWLLSYQEIKGTGYSNRYEVEAVVTFFKQLKLDKLPDKPMEVAILSPYNMQKGLFNNKEYRKQLKDALPKGMRFRESPSAIGNGENPQPAYSIDSFQGNEADVVVISLVRNKVGKTTASNIKFITEPERLNVMLSRAKQLLILVGCWEFLCNSVQNIPSQQNSDGNYNDSVYGPFKKVLETIKEYFDEGLAVKLELQELKNQE